MKAIDISGSAPGGERQKLLDILPLEAPLVVQFHPINLCNLKCNYCSFSLKKNLRPFTATNKTMSMETFQNGIDSLELFQQKIKLIRLTGLGEPLLHKNIVDMITYITIKNVAEKTEIASNGILLNKNMCDGLIQAGLTKLTISVQGLTGKKYKEVCNVQINVDDFLKNIEYYYEHKKDNQSIHIKIINLGLENDNEKQMFFDMFGNICDTIGIENAVPIQRSLKRLSSKISQYGMPVNHGKNIICPLPFYLIHLSPDGFIIPCCGFDYPLIVGVMVNSNIYETWNNEIFRTFRAKMTEGKNKVCQVCQNCTIPIYRMFPEDNLNDDIEKMKLLYRE